MTFCFRDERLPSNAMILFNFGVKMRSFYCATYRSRLIYVEYPPTHFLSYITAAASLTDVVCASFCGFTQLGMLVLLLVKFSHLLVRVYML